MKQSKRDSGTDATIDITRFELFDVRAERVRIDRTWSALLATCEHSFFLSEGWTRVWLDTLPPNAVVHALVGYADDKARMACFLGSRGILRHGVFKVDQLALNTTLVEEVDDLTLEYNGILCELADGLSLATVIDGLPHRDWDEFRLPLVTVDSAQGLVLPEALPGYDLESHETRSYFVDLEEVRGADGDYLSMISGNKRSQIRRSLKEYEKSGSLAVHEATSVQEALSILGELKLLHQKEWGRRGRPGAFSTEYFNRFHERLIEARFDEGEIQLLRVHAGETTIGVLYNFLYNGRVLFYQSGFDYRESNVYRPGLVSHYLAVQHNAERGHLVYDFLAGEGQYKQSLSTGHTVMRTAVVQRRKLKFTIEKQLKRIYRSIRS